MTRASAAPPAVSPRSLDEAIEALGRDPDLRPVAGCTDLMVRTLEERESYGPVLNLLTVPEIHGITREDGSWRIGATTTFTEIQRHPGLRDTLPILAEAASLIGGWQIQNRATIGGNMANASPAGDSLPVLLALDAVVTLAGPDGMREVPYTDFHTGYRKTALRPGEILAWVRVHDPTNGSIQQFRKMGTREAQSISKVVLAMVAREHGGRLSSVRFGAGSVAATPVRLAAAERICENMVPDESLADAAARKAMEQVVPIDDVRSTAAYRLHVLGRAVRRMVLGARRNGDA
jgi:CO/xanthine dehydrogenase FAD-binding subunit